MSTPLPTALQGLARDGRTWCSVGTVTVVEAHAAWGWLATVTLQPSQREVQGRMAQLGAIAAGGLFWPVAVGDEVLVVFPDADPNAAICLPWLASLAAPVPTTWDNLTPQLVHPLGLTLRLTQAGVPLRVVTEDFLVQLQAALTEVQAGMAAFGLPTTNLSTLLGQLPTAYRTTALASE